MYFRKPLAYESAEFMPVANGLLIVGGNIANKLSVVSLGRAFREMGFDKAVRNHTRGYIVKQRTAEEIKMRRTALHSDQQVTDVTDETVIF
jgi:hypothetical protein